ADGAAEVLGRDDGRGVHRPRGGELDALLLEDRLTRLPVRLDDVPALPLDLVVRVDARRGEHALDGQPTLAALGPAGGLARAVRGLRHVFPPGTARGARMWPQGTLAFGEGTKLHQCNHKM